MKRRFIVTGIIALFLPLFVFATGGNPGGGGGVSITLPNPLQCTPSTSPEFICVLNKVILALIQIAIPIVAIMIIFGAFQMFTAGGDPEKIRTGRHTIIWAVIGFAVLLIADGVALIIQSIVTP